MPVDAPTPDRLLDATVARLAAGGASAVSIAAVREDVGVSVGAVYHHFPNLQALLDAAWLRTLARHQEAVLAAVPGADGARDGVEGGVRAYLAWHAANRAEAVVLREPGPPRERPDAWRRRAALNGPFFGALAAWWREQAAAGALRDLAPVHVHALWLGPARDLCDLWLQGVPGADPAAAADVLAAAAWRSVGLGPA